MSGQLDKVIRRAAVFEKRLKACLRHGDFSGELATRAAFWIDTSRQLQQRLKKAKLK
jgi:hypothetical protein